ncbi:MAG: sigma-70 domain-containing protein [Clostridia bacterium]|nr:hypothetical protein [[Bacteroides] pectinophilus]MDD5874211.1 sigma-70 domain-containing protein [Clostridia bacterium]
MEQQLFIEALENLKIFAKSNGDKVTKADVLDCIGHDAELDDAKWQMVAGYLKTNGIELTDVELTDHTFERQIEEADKRQAEKELHKEQQEDEDSDAGESDKKDSENDTKIDAQEKQLLDMYLEDLKSIAPLSRTTQAVILQDVCDKDVESRGVIINNYFLQVVEWVKAYAGKGVAMMDLIQEANVIVMDELGKRDWMKQLDAFDVMDSDDINAWTDLSERLDAYLIDRVKEGVEKLIEEQTDEKMAGNKILTKVNAVNDAAEAAHKEYGRKVTVEELAQFMHVPVEDVSEALRLSANKIENVVVPD